MLSKWCDYTGEDPGDAHERLLRMAVVPDAVENRLGGVEFVLPSSADLSPLIFGRLIETLHREAAEAGVVL